MQKTNRSKLLSLVLTLAIVMSLFAGLTISASAYTPNGTMTYLSTHTSEGTSGTVWSISSEAELVLLASYVNYASGTTTNNTIGVTFYLTKDLTLNSAFNAASINPANAGVPSGSGLTEWTPIGGGAATTSFKGTFDGQNFTVFNPFYNRSGNSGTSGNSIYNNIGLFGKLEENATLKNLKISGGYIGAERSVGGLVGKSWGDIINCHNLGTMVYSNQSKGVGGIVGANWVNSTANPPSISNSSNAGTVKSAYASGSAGGIAGENEGSIFNCRNTGAITSPYNAGGLVGSNKNDINKQPSAPNYNPNNFTGGTIYGGITNSYNAGTVTGKIAAGIAAYHLGSMRNCYNIGAISGSLYAGQIIGESNSSLTNESLFYSNTSNIAAAGRIISGSNINTIANSFGSTDTDKIDLVDELDAWASSNGYVGWTRDANNVINNGYPVFAA